MSLRLLLAATLASLPISGEFLSGRIVTDDGMPLPEETALVLRCGQSAVGPAGTLDGELFVLEKPGTWSECVVEVNAPGYRQAIVPARGLPPNPEIPGVVLYRLGRSGGASISVTHLAAPREAKRKFQDAIRQMQQGGGAQIENAVRRLEGALEVYPGYAQAWFELGRLRLLQKDTEGAVEALRRAVVADPWFVSPYEPLILLLRAAKATDEAESACESLRNINPALPAGCGKG